MNAHAVNETVDQPWQFELGQWITHKDQSMPSLVLSRFRAGGKKNMEIYGVRSFAHVDPQRDRIILGDCLRPIDEAAWADCLLTPDEAANIGRTVAA